MKASLCAESSCTLIVHVCVNTVHEPHQQETGADCHPADPPETTRVEPQHELDVIAETVGTWSSHTDTSPHNKVPNSSKLKSSHSMSFRPLTVEPGDGDDLEQHHGDDCRAGSVLLKQLHHKRSSLRHHAGEIDTEEEY